MSSNARKDKFLASIPQVNIELDSNNLVRRCKFNFSYFVKQPAGQSFGEWDQLQLTKLLTKLKDYSAETLEHWKKTPIGKSGSVLAVYGAFPAKSDFDVPKHVPYQAQWGRFRLEHAVRLVGFILPSEYHRKAHSCGEHFDCNTFYVVFLDANHAFYKSEAK